MKRHRSQPLGCGAYPGATFAVSPNVATSLLLNLTTFQPIFSEVFEAGTRLGFHIFGLGEQFTGIVTNDAESAQKIQVVIYNNRA